MNIENIAISNKDILYSQLIEDEVALTAKIIICDFLPNGNDVSLNRQTINTWISTLVSNPVVGKIGVTDNGTSDFEGHNLYVVQRQANDGSVYKDGRFDTSAMGVFTDVSIENISGKEYIIATAKLWKRFPEFCAIVKKRLSEGTLNTSWEIAVKKFHNEIINGRKTKVIDEGSFLGQCLLGYHNPPACKDSQVLEVASLEKDNDLIEAISNDIANIERAKEEDILGENETIVKADETTTAAIDTESNTDTSSLTEFDLRNALRQSIADKIKKDKWDFYILHHFPVEGIVWIQIWDAASELDVQVINYTVENDIVTVSDPVEMKLTVSVAQINATVAELTAKINEQNDALVQSSTTIQTLTSQISDLTPYREKFEKSEQEKIEKELAEKRENLKSYALKSGHITTEEIDTSEEIKGLIENANETAIKSIIAERFMASLEKAEPPVTKEPTIETAQVKANINIDEEVVDHKSFIKQYIGKR